MSRIVTATPITLRGKEHSLLCDFAAISLIAEWTGRNALDGDNVLGDLVDTAGNKIQAAELKDPEKRKTAVFRISDPKRVSAVLAALLAHEDQGFASGTAELPALKPRHAARLIPTSEVMLEVMEKCAVAMAAFSPPAD